MPGPSLLRKDALHSEGFDSLRKVSLLDTSSLHHMKSQSALDEFPLLCSAPLRSEHYLQAIVKTRENLAGKKRLAL